MRTRCKEVCVCVVCVCVCVFSLVGPVNPWVVGVRRNNKHTVIYTILGQQQTHCDIHNTRTTKNTL